MGCSRCPGGGGAGRQQAQTQARVQVAQASQAPQNGNAKDYMEVEYEGSMEGARNYRGPGTGTVYAFSALPTGRKKLVHHSDLDFFRSRPDFRVGEAVPA